jgi:hypothetical protein
MVGPFEMRTDARVQVAEWHSEADFDLLDASHSGYERLPEPVTHRRRIVFRKESFAWLVSDSLEGRGEHLVESFLHLAPGGDVSVPSASETRTSEIDETVEELSKLARLDHRLLLPSEGAIHYAREGTGVLIVPLNWESLVLESGWFAPRWGQRVPAPVVTLSGRMAAGSSVGYLILPS